jgi:murein L,D-transpeptidase YcbB/YkuD
LALYLLSKEGWTAEQIDATVAKGTPDEVFETLKYVPLHRENFLPVYTLYQTAFVTGDGHLRLMTDYYGQDARLRTRLNLSASAAAKVSLPSANQQGEF